VSLVNASAYWQQWADSPIVSGPLVANTLRRPIATTDLDHNPNPANPNTNPKA